MMRKNINATKVFNGCQVNFYKELAYSNTYFNEFDGYFLTK